MGVAPFSSVEIKRLVNANNKKVNSMHKVWDILLKSLPELPKTRDLPCKEATGKQAKRAKESSVRVKSPPIARTAGPGIGDSSAGGEPVSDLLKTGFLSSPSACAKLADHVYRAGDLCAFLNLPLDKQEEAAMYHLQKGMVFAVGAMRNSRDVAPSSALLDELVKKNADLTDKFSNERIRHDARISEMKESLSMLKSSVGQKDSELKSLMATLLERKEAYFCLEHKHAALAQDRDKLLVKFDTHVEATEASKLEIAANAYKLGYLDCQNGASPCCPLEDDDGEQSGLDLPPTQSEQVDVVDAEAVEEQIADEADAKEQAAEAVEQVVPVGQNEAVASAVEDVIG
ncbi:hypothetical protein L3X38_029566 [Prunus dulcis]|uniref:Uncharacterized protein n=1 Tax=Prunus dulcis TaxID=3755 RepID=A0AAD4VS49_PRUDU|nr:hypothetical protein L3X38_029566 [Prunus dulcis]